MRKLTALFLALLMLISLAACDDSNNSSSAGAKKSDIFPDFEKITTAMTPDEVNTALGGNGVIEQKENVFDGTWIAFMADYDMTHEELGVLGVWEYGVGNIEVVWLDGVMLKKSIDFDVSFWLGNINPTLIDSSLVINEAFVDRVKELLDGDGDLSERFENSGLNYDTFKTELGSAGNLVHFTQGDPNLTSYFWAGGNNLSVYAGFFGEECFSVRFASNGSSWGRSVQPALLNETLAFAITNEIKED